MRTNNFFKQVAMLVCGILFLNTAHVWAVEFTPSNCTSWTASQAAQSQTLSSVTLYCSDGVNNTQLRLYKGSTTTITAPSGYNVTGVVFTCTAENTTKYGPGCFGTGAPSGYTYSSYTGTWSGSAASVSFTATDNQVRATSIVVTITASTTYAVTWKRDGVTIDTGSTYSAVPSGTTVTPPSAPSVPSGCTGAVFMGWTATENYSANTAPADLFTTTSPTITGNTTFYAVFADPD